MKVVINNCFGGFSLSHEAIMRYAELAGFKLYPFVEKRDINGNIDFKSNEFVPYVGDGKEFIIHYSKKPLVNGQYEEGAYWSDRELDRGDPALIQVVMELKKIANGRCAELKIINIPEGIEYEIEEYDGSEHVAEKHRTWR